MKVLPLIIASASDSMSTVHYPQPTLITAIYRSSASPSLWRIKLNFSVHSSDLEVILAPGSKTSWWKLVSASWRIKKRSHLSTNILLFTAEYFRITVSSLVPYKSSAHNSLLCGPYSAYLEKWPMNFGFIYTYTFIVC